MARLRISPAGMPLPPSISFPITLAVKKPARLAPPDAAMMIGRGQVAQAQACFLEPETDMNPILLKPNSDGGSQVVVHGKVWKTLPAARKKKGK